MKIQLLLLSFVFVAANLIYAAEVPREAPKKMVSELEKFLLAHPFEREAILQSVGYNDLLNLARATINKEMLEAMKAEIEKRPLVAYWAKGQIQSTRVGAEKYLDSGDKIISVALSPDGIFVAGAFSSGPHVAVYEVKNKRFINHPAHIGEVMSVGFDVDGNLLTFEDKPATVRINDVKTGKELKAFPIGIESPAQIGVAAFSFNARLLAVGLTDDTIKVWDMQKNREVSTISSNHKDILSLAISPDGTQVAAACRKGPDESIIVLFDMQTGSVIRELTEQTVGDRRLFSVAFSPDGKLLATGWGFSLILFELKSGEIIRRIDAGIPFSLAFSPDGKQLAGGIGQNAIYLFKVMHQQPKKWRFF